MSIAGPKVLIDGPLPSPNPFGIHTVAQQAVLAAGDSGGNPERWAAGADVRPYPPTVGSAVIPCDTGSLSAKDAGEEILSPEFGAFTAYVPHTCSTFGIDEWGNFQDRANRVLDALEQHHLELQLASGVFNPGNPFLGDLSLDVLAGAAVGPVEGLALLENAAAETGRAAVIHATPGTVIGWAAHGLLVQTQGRLFTFAGTPVVKGTGYVGTDPLGGGPPNTDQEWAFVTGPVVYRRGELFLNPSTIAEATDRSSNTVTYRAERNLLIAWDTQLQAGILIDRSV